MVGGIPRLCSSVLMRGTLAFPILYLHLLLELLPQHSLYCSEFRLANVTLVVHFSEIRQQVTGCLPVVIDAIAKPSHEVITHGQHDQQNGY